MKKKEKLKGTHCLCGNGCCQEKSSRPSSDHSSLVFSGEIGSLSARPMCKNPTGYGPWHLDGNAVEGCYWRQLFCDGAAYGVQKICWNPWKIRVYIM